MWSHICDQRITKQIKPVLPPTTLRARSQQISLLIACMQAARERFDIFCDFFLSELWLHTVYIVYFMHQRVETWLYIVRKYIKWKV